MYNTATTLSAFSKVSRNLGGFFMPRKSGIYLVAIPNTKPALPFAEHLNLLQGRGLVVDNKDCALNQLASNSRLWNRELTEAVRSSAGNTPVTPRQDRVFYILLILRVLLHSNHNGEHWAERCSELLETLVSKKKYRIAMGLPENWKEHPIWR